MNQPTEVLVAGICVATAPFLVIAARLFWHPTQPTAQPRTLTDPGVWLPCHAACAHMETRHDPTPVGGLSCRDCGHTLTEPSKGGN